MWDRSESPEPRPSLARNSGFFQVCATSLCTGVALSRAARSRAGIVTRSVWPRWRLVHRSREARSICSASSKACLPWRQQGTRIQSLQSRSQHAPTGRRRGKSRPSSSPPWSIATPIVAHRAATENREIYVRNNTYARTRRAYPTIRRPLIAPSPNACLIAVVDAAGLWKSHPATAPREKSSRRPEPPDGDTASCDDYAITGMPLLSASMTTDNRDDHRPSERNFVRSRERHLV